MAKQRDPRAVEAYRLHDNGAGQPLPRVAEMLKVPLPTVKSWIRRLRKERFGQADADAKAARAPKKDAHPVELRPTQTGEKPKTGHDTPICGARKRQGDRSPCRRPAGWGTSHPGSGQCKLHGGCAPVGQVGNKSAVVTGQYERLLREALPEDERDAFDSALSETDKIAKLRKQIALTEARILRMQKRLTYYQEQEAASADGLEQYGIDKGIDTGGESRDGEEKGERTDLEIKKSSKSITVKQRKWADRILRTELALNQTQKLLKDLVSELDALENPGKRGGVNIVNQVGVTWIEQAKEAAASRPAVTMDSRRF
jgi:uncharacterized protein YjcR